MPHDCTREGLGWKLTEFTQSTNDKPANEGDIKAGAASGSLKTHLAMSSCIY